MNIEGLPIRVLQRLDAAASRLRHSVVEACFYNLRILAQELPGRRGNGDFADRLAKALARLGEARARIDAHFDYEIAADLTIGDVFPDQKQNVAAALEKIESLAAAGAPSREDGPACREFSEEVVANVDALMDAIGVMEVEVAALRTPARPLLEELAELHRAACEQAGIEVSVENHADSQVRLLCDRPALFNALDELVRNALRHAFGDSVEGGRVTLGIGCDADTRDPVITVTDNGAGMGADRLALLGAAGASTSGGGDGVALVRRVVERQHGGLVTFRSALGEGTRVEVRLPRRTEPPLEEAPAAEGGVEELAGRRRVVAAMAVLLGMAVLGVALAWLALRAQKRVRLTVAADGSGDYALISRAVEAAPPGALIEVQSGEYADHIVLEKAVEIAGMGRREAVVRGVRGPALFSTAEGAVVRNLRLTVSEKAQSAAVLVKAGDLRLQDCEMGSQSLSCIEVAGGTPTVAGCLVREGQRSGIYVRDGATGVYEDLTVRDCRGSGIAVSDGAAPVVRRAVIERCAQGGVNVYAGGRGTFEHVEVSRCARAGFLVSRGGAPVVRFCQVHDNPDDGIAILDSGRGTFEHNQIWGNGGHGVLVHSGTAPTIRHNRIEGNGREQMRRMAGSPSGMQGQMLEP